MSEKKPYTVTITKNETGEVNSFDTTICLAAIDSGEGTTQVGFIDGAAVIDIASACLTLRRIEIQLRADNSILDSLMSDALAGVPEGQND